MLFELRMRATEAPLVVITADQHVVDAVPISGRTNVGVITNVQAPPSEKEIVPQVMPMPAGFR